MTDGSENKPLSPYLKKTLHREKSTSKRYVLFWNSVKCLAWFSRSPFTQAEIFWEIRQAKRRHFRHGAHWRPDLSLSFQSLLSCVLTIGHICSDWVLFFSYNYYSVQTPLSSRKLVQTKTRELHFAAVFVSFSQITPMKTSYEHFMKVTSYLSECPINYDSSTVQIIYIGNCRNIPLSRYFSHL